MTPVAFQLQPSGGPSTPVVCDKNLPVTSYACQWKPPRKRKQSNLAISEAKFVKHVYGKTSRRSFESIEDFDPRPVEYRSTASLNLPDLLDKIRGEQLCISLLLDPSFCHDYETSSSETTQLAPVLPYVSNLKETILAFKTSLSVTEDEIREIEQSTREQRNSTMWFLARRFRLTSSLFGAVLHRKPSTPPDALVMRIIQSRNIRSAALDWGIQHEPTAIMEYTKYQHQHGHESLVVMVSGFLVSS